jgi:putative MATE family efflux protein
MTGSMTKGSPWKLILLFSLPIMAGNLLQQLYNTADSVIVGQFVSQEALGAVGTCSPLTMLLIAVAVGLSTGASILISQLFGAGQMDEMRKSVSTALALLTGLGVFMLLLGVVSARWLLKYALSVPDSVLDMATMYLRIYSLGLVFQFIYNIVAAILRSLGDSRATLYFLLVSSVVNIVLDLLFVAVLPWGVAGAAAATVIAQGCSAAVSVWYMFHKYEMLRFSKGSLSFEKTYCITMLKLGIPVALQQCVISMGHLFIQRLVNHYGTDMMSGYTAASRLENYVLIPIFGFNAGMNVYVGQNVGAGQIDRVKQGFRQTVVMSAVLCVVLSGLMLTLGGQIVKIFGISGQSLALAQEYLRGVSPFFLVFAVYQVAAATLQGSGDVSYATACTLGSLAIRIVLSYFLAYNTPLSYRAIWWALVVGWLAGLIPAYIRYFGGAWKTKKLV